MSPQPNALESLPSVPVGEPTATIFSRIRLWLAAALTLALLYYTADALIRGGSSLAPIVILGGRSAFLTAPLVALILLAGAWIGTFLIVRRDACDPLVIAGVALLGWSLFGGTSDDWLILCRPNIEPPTGAAYAYFVAEYLYLALVFLAIASIGVLRPMTGQTSVSGFSKVARQLLEPAGGDEILKGMAALGLSTIVSGALLCVLFGPILTRTMHGQVLFAVAVACGAGTYVAHRVTHARGPFWYWTAPFLVGLIGSLLASFKPTLFIPPGYTGVSTLAASGMVRPLPIQLVGIGVVSVVLSLRSFCRTVPASAGKTEMAKFRSATR
jgi:hypothetical protein